MRAFAIRIAADRPARYTPATLSQVADMRRATFAVVVLLATIPAVGCGTMSNQSELVTYGNRTWGGHRVYGGVRADVELLTTPVFPKAATPDEPADDRYAAVLTVAKVFIQSVYLIDLPLSLVGDTILWPVDTAAQVRRFNSAEPVEPPPVEETAKPPAGALEQLKGNKFNTWQYSPRVDVPLPAR